MSNDRPIVKFTEKSEKQIKEETIEKIDRISSQKGPLDIFEVMGGDPHMEYRWLNTRKDALEFEKLRGKWEIVNSTTAPNVKTLADKGEGGVHVIGDVVLAMRPKSIGDEERRKTQEIRRKRREGLKREFVEEAYRRGIKPIEND